MQYFASPDNYVTLDVRKQKNAKRHDNRKNLHLRDRLLRNPRSGIRNNRKHGQNRQRILPHYKTEILNHSPTQRNMKNFKKFILQGSEKKVVFINPASISSFRELTLFNGSTDERTRFTRISLMAGPDINIEENIEQTIAILEA